MYVYHHCAHTLFLFLTINLLRLRFRLFSLFTLNYRQSVKHFHQLNFKRRLARFSHTFLSAFELRIQFVSVSIILVGRIILKFIYYFWLTSVYFHNNKLSFNYYRKKNKYAHVMNIWSYFCLLYLIVLLKRRII